jgi:hypothetical protein
MMGAVREVRAKYSSAGRPLAATRFRPGLQPWKSDWPGLPMTCPGDGMVDQSTSHGRHISAPHHPGGPSILPDKFSEKYARILKRLMLRLALSSNCRKINKTQIS